MGGKTPVYILKTLGLAGGGVQSARISLESSDVALESCQTAL